MEYISFLCFFGPVLALITREVINPYSDLPNLTFDSENVILILSRLSDFNKIPKVTYLSLTFIYLCFLKLLQQQFFMFTAENSPSVNFSLHVNF